MVTLTRDERHTGTSGAADTGAPADGTSASSASDAPDPGRRRSKKVANDAARPLKRDMPLVPADTIAGRALITVIAIMTFLAALTAGIALLVAGAAADWQTDIAREMTIQVRPMPGADLDAMAQAATAIARATPGVAAADAYTKAASEALLQPWLGSGLDLADLPVPRLIVVKRDGTNHLDVPALRRALADGVVGVSLDDHGAWLARLATMTHAMVGIALVIFGLVLTAMLLAVAFATRGAMAGAKDIIEVLHFVGAADGFISRQFQNHFLRLGLRGGLIGGGVAVGFFLLGGRVLGAWRASAGGEQVEAMFGAFGLHAAGYGAIAAVAGTVALLTGGVSRLIVYRHLRRMM